MKRVAILTRRAGYNMGSTLQAYAMSKMISKLGYEVVILNYDEYARFFAWRVKPFIINILNRIPFLVRIKAVYKRFPLDRILAQQKKFKQFEASYFPLSVDKYKNSRDLKRTLGAYDVYVCGSDQIWSPMMFDPVFFLDFIPQKSEINTIAYAPSLGVVREDAISNEAKDLIKHICHVSCREFEGAEVLSKILGKQIPTVLDPTLMLDLEDWNAVRSSETFNNHNDYILTYFLYTDAYKDNIPNIFIDRLKKITGLKVLNIQMYNMNQVVNADDHIYDAGPADFLSLISNARYIITNSFHCCVFSYLFSKRFFVFEKYRKGTDVDNQNPRLYTLLETINRREALIRDETAEIDLTYYPAKDNDSDLFLSRKRASMSFIINSLNNQEQ